MPTDRFHTWIYLLVTPEGFNWPSRDDCENTLNLARVPGRWLNDTEFETADGSVMLIPATAEDGWRYGPIDWGDSSTVRIETR